MPDDKVRVRKRSRHKRGELVFVFVLLAFSVGGLWQAFLISGFSKWSSPGVFPMLAAATMLLSAVFIVRNAICSTTENGVESDEKLTDEKSLAEKSLPVWPRHVALVAILLVAFVLAMPMLGFILTSGLFLLSSISILWKKSWIQTLLVTSVSLVFIYVIFRLVFQVVLPEGWLFQ